MGGEVVGGVPGTAGWSFEGIGLPDGDAFAWVAGAEPRTTLPGRFAVTGLVDAHCHLTVDDDDEGLCLGGEELAEARLRGAAALGVSAVRDVGGARAVTLPLARTSRRGLPQVEAAGRFLSSVDRYFPRMFDPVTAEELIPAIHAEIDDGATWVKLVGDFPLLVQPRGPMAPTFDAVTIRAAVEAAHARGARVAAHTQTAFASDLIALGVDSVEHGTLLTAADLDALGERGGAWTPTLSAAYKIHGDTPDSGYLVRGDFGERMSDLLPHALAAGVSVLAGTDVVGSMVSEVRLLVAHGLSVEQALRAATSDAQDYLGLGSSGDIVTYHADPREDPAVLAHPAAVVLRGDRVA